MSLIKSNIVLMLSTVYFVKYVQYAIKALQFIRKFKLCLLSVLVNLCLIMNFLLK